MENFSLKNSENSFKDVNFSSQLNINKEEKINNENIEENKHIISTLNLTRIDHHSNQISLEQNFNNIIPMKRTHETLLALSIRNKNKENESDNYSKYYSKANSFIKKRIKLESIKAEKILDFSNFKDNKNSQMILNKDIKTEIEKHSKISDKININNKSKDVDIKEKFDDELKNSNLLTNLNTDDKDKIIKNEQTSFNSLLSNKNEILKIFDNNVRNNNPKIISLNISDNTMRNNENLKIIIEVR